jgi:hypothetical protein
MRPLGRTVAALEEADAMKLPPCGSSLDRAGGGDSHPLAQRHFGGRAAYETRQNSRRVARPENASTGAWR